MTNLDRQLDHIWNQLGPKHLGTPVRNYSPLDHLRWENPAKVWATSSHVIVHQRTLFACLPSLSLTSSSILLLSYSFTGLKTYF